nr:ALPV-132 [Albatrosspox virus]
MIYIITINNSNLMTYFTISLYLYLIITVMKVM